MRTYRYIMTLFLQQTKKEVNFIITEILKLSKYFQSKPGSNSLDKLFESDEAFKESTKFFKPLFDSEGVPVKADCLEALKRAIFKLASVFERVNLFKGRYGAAGEQHVGH